MPKFVEVRTEEWVQVCKDAARWKKLQKCVLLPQGHLYRLKVEDWRSPPMCNLDMEIDAIPDEALG